MRARRGLIVGAAMAVALAAAPRSAAAQDTRGWWDWALGELVRSGSGQIPVPRPGGTYPRSPDDRTSRYPDTRAPRYPDSRAPRYPDDDDRYERDDRRERRGRKGGPKFCQSGAGHPVHGRQWCRDKGYALGTDRRVYRRDVYWQDRGWEDIILRAPRRTDRRGSVVDRGGLIDVLGDVVYRRLDLERRRLGGREPLSGRWISPAGGARVLQIRSGSVPVAELTDLDGDGRIDAALVPRR